MGGYDRAQQLEDLAVLNATIGALGARTIGEKRLLCENYLQDYIRIARYWAHPKLGNPIKQIDSYRMFLDLAENERISAFSLSGYERLLKDCKKLVQAKIFRRRKKPDTCLDISNHRQACFCGNMARGVARQAVIEGMKVEQG